MMAARLDQVAAAKPIAPLPGQATITLPPQPPIQPTILGLVLPATNPQEAP